MNQTETLLTLVERWRKHSDNGFDPDEEEETTAYWRAVGRCADELDAALAAPASTPQPVLVDSTGLLVRAAQYAALVRYEPSPALTLIMELRAALAATMVGSTHALPSPPVGEPTKKDDDVSTRSVMPDVDRPPQHAPTNQKASSE